MISRHFWDILPMLPPGLKADPRLRHADLPCSCWSAVFVQSQSQMDGGLCLPISMLGAMALSTQLPNCWDRRNKMKSSYSEKIRVWGRIWCSLAGHVYPLPCLVVFTTRPGPTASLLKGLIGVAPIFWTVGAIEAFTFAPMLGSGGSYLGFVTGNLTNLKVPCALNAMEIAGVKPGTEEGELISTIAIAVSSIVTTLIIFLGVILLSQLQPILESELLAPAFDNILPALFGALAVVFISKNWKIAMAPLIFMLVLFISVPSLAGSVSVLVPVGAIIAIGAARILYNKGYL